MAATPPRVEHRRRIEADAYAARANVVAIRHRSDHRVVAVVEIVSPGNKTSRHGIRSFIDKAMELLRAGIHLLIVDLFPPGRRDPQGLHNRLWAEFEDHPYDVPEGRPLTLAGYVAGACPEAFVQPMAVGQPLAEMPLFLSDERYITVPLEATYLAAWGDVPAFWQRVLAATTAN